MYCKACQNLFRGSCEPAGLIDKGPYAGIWKRPRILSLFLTGDPVFIHHENGGLGLKASALSGCELCSLLWKMLSTDEKKAVCDEYPNGFSGDEEVGGGLASCYAFEYYSDTKQRYMKYFLKTRPAIWPKFEKGVFIKGRLLVLDLDSIGAERMPMEPFLSPRTWSAEILLLVQRWLQICDTTHQTCKRIYRTGWCPTRLVHVGTKDLPTLRVCLSSEALGDTRYTSLSHCWGSIQPFKLLESNYQQCLDSIRVEDLPQTFQDAIVITRDLGIRYIWIDSLCIIQDQPSLEDWTRESLTMADVYSHSFCNIAAASAADGHGGCIKPRAEASKNSFNHLQPPNTIFQRSLLGATAPFTSESKFEYSSTGYGFKRPGARAFGLRALPPGNHQFVDSKIWEHEIIQSPLSIRAWVFQEFLLSRRTLYFCSQQVFFGCSDMGACEEFADGFPKTMTVSDRTLPLIAESNWSQMISSATNTASSEIDGTVIKASPDYLQTWCKLIKEYSSKRITKLQDKLVAVSGLAIRIQATNPCLTYFAGIWRDQNDLHDEKIFEQLLWRCGERVRSRDKTYLAPTWSWATFHHEVDFVCSNPPFAENKHRKTLASVIDISTETVGDSPFMCCTSGSLRLKGLVLPGKLEKSDTIPKFQFKWKSFVWSDTIRGEFQEDAMADLGPETKVFCIPVLLFENGPWKSPTLCGIVLKEIDGSVRGSDSQGDNSNAEPVMTRVGICLFPFLPRGTATSMIRRNKAHKIITVL